MPTAVDQISKRYTVCLLCLHYKFSYFLPKMTKSLSKLEKFELKRGRNAVVVLRKFGVLIAHHFHAIVPPVFDV